MCTKMLKSWTFSGSTLAGSCCCCHRTNKGKVFPSSALIANAIYISESLYHCGLNFARYVILSSGSGRVIGCILQQTHSFRDPSLAVVGLTERSTRLVQCYCWLKKRTSQMARRRRGRGGNGQHHQQAAAHNQRGGPRRVSLLLSLAKRTNCTLFFK